METEKALSYFRKSARLGNTNAMCTIGWIYGNGEINGKIDLHKSVNWYIKSASLDENHLTEFIIGSIYLEGGPGLKPNLKEAIKWYLKAANGGVNAAKIRLEKLCCKGNK